MKARAVATCVSLLIGATFANSASTQTADPPPRTTRILAIGTIEPGVDLASVRATLPEEVKETIKLYLAGKIDQWFSLTDRNGVVFLLNVTDLRRASEMLEALPLGKANMMRFELTPLGPLTPLRTLIGPAADHTP